MLNQEALKKVITGSRDERVYLCSKDFALFFCYYFVDYIKLPFAPFHYEMFQDINDLIAGNIRELAWFMFRESAKTSITKGFISYLICYKIRNYPNVDSFDKENAERILFDTVMELQTNPRIKADFGELFNAKRNPDEIQQKRVNNFVTNNKVRLEAHSTQESVRGRLHGNQRPDALILDDFETNKTKDSKAYTDQVAGHIEEFLTGLDSKALTLYLGNYITELGNVHKLIERSKRDKGLRVRMVAIIENEKPTWPEKYALTDIEAQQTGKISLEDKKRQLGSVVFSREMMNEPISSESQIFKRAFFKYRTWEEVQKLNTRKFATIDTALSKEAKSDYCGVVRNYVDRENKWNLKGNQYRYSPGEVINLIFDLHDEGMEKIGIEKTVYLDVLLPFFKEECRKRNKHPRVVELKHGGTMKESRIEALLAYYEAGSIYHVQGDTVDMEDQLLRFPLGEHDDIIDAEQYQSQIAEPPYVPTMADLMAQSAEARRNLSNGAR